MKSLSICIIAKNEEKNIGNCISAIHKEFSNLCVNYEICLVDTGSSDATIDIASNLDATIHNYVWQNDFSAARNYATSVAKYNYILFVDADEILETANWLEVCTLLDKYPTCVGMISRRNLCNSGSSTAITVDKVARLFDRRLYHYELSIHEQLVANDNSQLTVYDIPLTFYHEGYMGTIEQLAAKAKRNNDLLFKELELTPNDPYILFQIAQSYGLINDKDNHYLYCQKAYDLSPDINDVYTTDLILSLGYAYINRNEYEKAIILYNRHYSELKHISDYLCLGILAHIKIDRLVEAIAICNICLTTKDYYTEGSNSDIPYYYLGCIYETYGNMELAKKYFSLANHYADSDKRILSIDTNISQSTDYYYKKISIIIPTNCISSIDCFMNNILAQTLDINSIELIFIGALTRLSEPSYYESEYPNSIMLINIDEAISDNELIDIAIPYATGEYICIYDSRSDFTYIDGLRHIYTASHNEHCDIGACNIEYGDLSDFYITINSPAEAIAIKQANILSNDTSHKIYQNNFINKNNLDYSKLFDNAPILSAQKIYCSKILLL